MTVIVNVQKDPDEVLDYVRDWTAELGQRDGDTIASSEWFADDGITVEAAPRQPSHTTTTTTVWLSGGTVGQRHKVTNRIVTAGGRTLDATMQVTVVPR